MLLSFPGVREGSASQNTQRVELREGGETRIYEAKLVVGADGPFSRVRQAADLECTVKRYGLNWANTIIPKDEDDIPAEGHVFFGRGVYLGVVPTRARELVTFHLTARANRDDYIREFGTIDKLRSYYVGIAPILGKCAENLRSWDQVACPPAVRISSTLVGDKRCRPGWRCRTQCQPGYESRSVVGAGKRSSTCGRRQAVL